MRAEYEDRARRAAAELEAAAAKAGKTPGASNVDVCNRVRAILGLPQTDEDGNEVGHLPGSEPSPPDGSGESGFLRRR